MVEAKHEWFEKDYYAVLGVEPDATAKQVTQAYRKLARELHPDANPDNKAAEDRFKEVSAAYEVLGDDEKRQQYDQARRFSSMGTGQPGGYTFRFDTGGDLDDLLGGFFGSDGPFARRGRSGGHVHSQTRPRRPGVDQDAELALSFEEAVAGMTTAVTLSDARGTRDIRVRIPAGVADGQRIRITGKGGAGTMGAPAGDLYVTVRVGTHPVFGRSGADLTMTLPISFSEAALGADVKVPTFDSDPVTVRIPPGTSSGKTFRVKGHGVRTAKTTGDLLVTVEVAVPDELNDAQRVAVEAFAAADGESPRAGLPGYPDHTEA